MEKKGEKIVIKKRKRLNLSGPVRITLPAKVAYNLDSLQSSISNIMERLGCGNCFSGADCTFRLEREFIIDPDAKIGSINRPISVVGSTDPDGDPIMPVNVMLDTQVSHSIQQVHEAVARVVGLLGCPMCSSGFDIAFRSELKVITVDKELEVREFGQI